MKKIIRRGCFETNSSSTHSISVSSGDKLSQTVQLDSGGKFIYTPNGDYGWEQCKYGDVMSKIDYMGIYIRDWATGREDEFKSILEDVIKEQSGSHCVKIDFGQKQDGSWPEYEAGGYIDHQSVECSDYHYLFEEPSRLRDFLFSAASSFETDNDNY